jgi:hypothetical protein
MTVDELPGYLREHWLEIRAQLVAGTTAIAGTAWFDRRPIPVFVIALLCILQFLGLLVSAAIAEGGPIKPQTRCGWFSNPTPGNAWLVDRDGEWTIGIQGGHQANGDWPSFKPSQWVRTNNSYGYGCACVKLIAKQDTREVVSIHSAHARPLSACRRDRALKQPT